MKNILKYGLMAVVAATAMTACSDWTDPEPVNVVHDGVADTNPEAYAKYLENLRAYRTNGHKKVFAWYENKGSFNSQADRVSAVPDSIDVLVLMAPDQITAEAQEDIQKKRANTGMDMATTVDYDAIKAAWTALKEVETPEAPAPEWNTYLAASLSSTFGNITGAGLNRVIVAFPGKNLGFLNDAEKTQYLADQTMVFKAVTDWAAADAGRKYDYMGHPVNITDGAFIAGAQMLFLSETLTANSTTEYLAAVQSNVSAGISPDRLAVMAPLPGTDSAGNAVGNWGNSYTAWDVAAWTRTAAVGALGLTNLRNDYYNPNFNYPVCRGAIQTLNPAAN